MQHNMSTTQPAVPYDHYYDLHGEHKKTIPLYIKREAVIDSLLYGFAETAPDFTAEDAVSLFVDKIEQDPVILCDLVLRLVEIDINSNEILDIMMPDDEEFYTSERDYDCMDVITLYRKRQATLNVLRKGSCSDTPGFTRVNAVDLFCDAITLCSETLYGLLQPLLRLDIKTANGMIDLMLPKDYEFQGEEL